MWYLGKENGKCAIAHGTACVKDADCNCREHGVPQGTVWKLLWVECGERERVRCNMRPSEQEQW